MKQFAAHAVQIAEMRDKEGKEPAEIMALLSIKPRKFHYMLGIGRKIRDLSISIELADKIGWTRFSKIYNIIDKGNMGKILHDANILSSAMKIHVNKKGANGTADRCMIFYFSPPQYEVVRAAMDKALNEKSPRASSRSDAFAMMAARYLQES